ncbi:hypothetical protein [Roseovarius ramblicola]|uniref:Uncharacterized protein n=1 Tax=Roseovarius ramblicola TaxID=2022336 RepID=A0ABV5HYN9_9RHOB
MMGPDTEISLGALHQAIIDAVAAQFPDLATVGDYREDRAALPLPAVLIEMADLEGAPDEDPGTGQLAMVARFDARVIIGFRTAAAEREIRKLAGALGAFAHLNRWGLPVAPAEVLSAGPDDFAPELDQYVVWRVEWAQVIHLGTSVWVNDGTIPARVLYSVAPEIGPAHEDDYRDVTEAL